MERRAEQTLIEDGFIREAFQEPQVPKIIEMKPKQQYIPDFRNVIRKVTGKGKVR